MIPAFQAAGEMNIQVSLLLLEGNYASDSVSLSHMHRIFEVENRLLPVRWGAKGPG